MSKRIDLAEFLNLYAEGKLGSIVRKNEDALVFSTGQVVITANVVVMNDYREESGWDLDGDQELWLCESEEDAVQRMGAINTGAACGSFCLPEVEE